MGSMSGSDISLEKDQIRTHSVVKLAELVHDPRKRAVVRRELNLMITRATCLSVVIAFCCRAKDDGHTWPAMSKMK